MNTIRFLAWLALVGCMRGTVIPSDTGTPTQPTGSIDTSATGPFPNLDETGNYGWVIVGESLQNAERGSQTYAFAYVLQEDLGVVNLPGCLWRNHICTPSYPAIGDSLSPEES